MNAKYRLILRQLIAIMFCICGIFAAPRLASAANEVLIIVAPPGASSRQPTPPGAMTANSLQEAISLVRKLRAKSTGEQGYRISLQAGTYVMRSPLVLTAEDSGTPNSPLIIEGAPGRSAVLDGGVKLSPAPPGAQSTFDERIPDSARAGLLRLSVPADLADMWNDFLSFGYSMPTPAQGMPTQITEDGEPTQLARWPANGFVTVEPIDTSGTAFAVESASAPPVPSAVEFSAFGYWGNNWSTEWIRVRSDGGGRFSVAGPRPPLGIRNGQRAFLAGAPEFLGEPGQWIFDKAARMVLYTPHSSKATPVIEAAIAPQLLVLRGASHIRLQLMTLENARDDLFTAANSDDVILSHLTLRNCGRSALVMSNVTRSGIEYSSVTNTGGTAIVVSSGQRETLSPGDSFVRRSSISNFGMLMPTYQPGIMLQGVGDVIEHNELAFSPHAAIIFSGNDHRIDRNIIHDVVRDTDDAGAIYTGRDWTAQGTSITNNFIYDIHGIGPHGATAIYLDDQASGISIQQNVIAHADRGVLIGGGRSNNVTGNLFVDTAVGVFADDRGLNWQRQQTQDPNWVLQSQLRHFDVRHPPYSDRYPALASISPADFGIPEDNKIQDNVAIGGKTLELKMRPQSVARQSVTRNFDSGNSPAYWVNGQEPARAAGAQAYRLTASALAGFPWFTPPDIAGVGPLGPASR